MAEGKGRHFLIVTHGGGSNTSRLLLFTFLKRGERDMVKLKIGEKEYGLRLDMYAMEQIEEEFGTMQEMFEKIQSRGSKSIQKIFRILANAELAYEGKEETVTGDELKRLKVSAMAGIGKAIRAAVEEGMKSETTEGAEADDEVFDVYLAEIEAKN